MSAKQELVFKACPRTKPCPECRKECPQLPKSQPAGPPIYVCRECGRNIPISERLDGAEYSETFKMHLFKYKAVDRGFTFL